MAIVKVTNSKTSIGKAISYVTKEEKTEDRLISGINCTPESAIDEMNATKEQFRKTEGRQYAHYIHSFKPGENIDHEQAHKLALELAEKQFKGYEVLVATHKDKDHIHSHIIVNSVSFENGQKFHSSKKDLAKVKEISNKICEREGLSITKPNRELTSFNMKKYKALERGYDKNDNYSSYMLELWKNVSSSIKVATSKEQFVESMNQKGYGVKWSDTRKYITFIPPKGKGRPIRNSTLAETFKNDKFSKEELLNEFRINGERILGGRESNNGDNKQTVRNRSDIEKSIIYGGNKVYSLGDNELIKHNKEDNGKHGEENRTIGEREESSRGTKYEEHTEHRKDSRRIAKGNERIEGDELQEDRRDSSDSRTVSEFNSENIHEFSGDITRSKQYEGLTEVERQSDSIFTTTRDNRRNDIDDNRSLSHPNNLLDKIEPLNKDISLNDKKIDIAEQMLAKDPEALKAYRESKAKGDFKIKAPKKDRDRGFDI